MREEGGQQVIEKKIKKIGDWKGGKDRVQSPFVFFFLFSSPVDLPPLPVALVTQAT